MNLLARAIVAAFSLFLVGLATLIMVRPALARRFLSSFASSATAHYTEQALRLLVSAAIVFQSGSMRYPEIFRLFGWVMAISTAGLLLMPWRWHRDFAARVMPPVLRHVRVFALGAVALGVFVGYSLTGTRAD